MATETPEADRPMGQRRRIWSLAEDDQRMLYVTFIGSLGAIIAGVLVVGLGVLVSRAVASTHHALLVFAVAVAVPVLLAFGITLYVVLGIRREERYFTLMTCRRLAGNSLDRAMWRYAIGATAIAALAVAIVILGAVGYAAGIK